MSLYLCKAERLEAASVLVSANVSAMASPINPDCPNGCFSDGNGCHCNGDYPFYREATEYWAKQNRLD